ncbi:MAG: tyrosine-type recombinase/integrase, partial [Terriglobales bacterium]
GLIKHLKGAFKGSIAAITPFAVEKYKQARLEAGKAPATVNREVACLKHMLNMAVQWGYLRDNHLRPVRLLREENIVERIVTSAEETRLLAAAHDPLRDMLVVALHSGMRLGEILKLPWSCVDFERSLITIINAKNGRSRKVPMNAVVVETLKQRRPTQAKVATALFVFGDPRTGRPFGSVKTAFRATLRRAEIKSLRFHDLRHTFATRLVADGVDLVSVKELLGHSDIGMTMRYAHPSEANLRQAVALLAKRPASRYGHQMDTKAKAVGTASAVSH